VNEESNLTVGSLHLVTILQGLYSIVTAVLTLHGLHLVYSHRIAACPELDGVEYYSVYEEAYATYDRLKNQTHDTVNVLVAGHVALPLLVFIEETERTNT
jgi:hypothetical protein